MGLEGLLTIMMWGHHNGKLYNIGQYQRDWYAHIPWTVYKVCAEFLEQHLTEANLLVGVCLANPFTAFNHKITCLQPYENSGCSICICNPVPSWSTPSGNTTQAQKQLGTCTAGNGSGSPGGGSRGATAMAEEAMVMAEEVQPHETKKFSQWPTQRKFMERK